ncbi:MAG: tyrosine--tRNA ligase [Saprospiraceae bacterium]|uniref:Tyrosine--tRNA ligase n=1 Tax=Candidatus Opimibacter skivensis TaxID=2982028 RepID=A0A9D7SQK0_9BACT|nr:tyrosine--tRNA ligase [Candidatus Opimibacter skivensis]
MKKSFIEELKWRGMIHDLTPGVEEKLASGMVTGYIGFDPTAPSMTIGNLVQIMILKFFQLSGHKPIVLMGGATGRIGDPSGKDAERELKSYEELDHNLAHQAAQVRKLLDFEGPNAAVLINNLDFYRDMNALDFLRDVGKHITINYMLSKDSVKNRMDTGMSYTEFSYQLLQAYDFLCLYRDHDCVLQMGGSDQWGNITSGTEFIRRNISGSNAFALTTPLLTKADGKKFGKSEEGNVWLDPMMTSPYKFYQFWLNVDDKDLPKLYRFFSLLKKDEIELLETDFGHDPNTLKAILGEELTIRIHGEKAYEAANNVSNILFNPKASKEQLLNLDIKSLELISQEIPSFQINKDELINGINIIDLLSEKTKINSSRSEARRSIESNAISLNKDKITDIAFVCKSSDLLHDRFVMIENGKKNKYVVEFV